MPSKITSYRLDFKSGDVVGEKEDIHVRNFNDGEAAVYYRKFLIAKDYKEYLGTTVVKRKKYGELRYLTLFEKPLKIRFAMWRAKKETEDGKAVLWIGEKNIAEFTQEQVDYGMVIRDRILPLDVLYYGVIVIPRDFRVGMNLLEQKFVDYLLIPLEDLIEFLKETGRPNFDIKQEQREKYRFDNIIERLKQ
jgi:hypothetical protein